MAAPLRAEDAPPDAAALPVREFRLEHVDVKEANAIVRSLLNVRKSAVDERRQILMIGDTADRLDQVAAIIAKIDVAPTEWRVALVARAGGKDTTLRTASITQGSLQVQFGPSPVTPADNLGVRASLRRATSGEIEMEWAASLSMPDRWSETAGAVETLHDGATVVVVRTDDPSRRVALSNLLGVQGTVESLTLEVSRVGDAPPPRRQPVR